MKMTRRQLGLTVGSLALVTAAGRCSTTTAVVIDSQVLADANGIIGAIPKILAGIQEFDPNLIPVGSSAANEITTAETVAAQAVANLSNDTPAQAAATTLSVVETDVTTCLQVLGAVLPAAAVAFPALAPYVGFYDAAVALLPGVEAWVSATLTTLTPQTTSSATKPPAPIRFHYTQKQARQLLGVQGG